jgi:hypothetical protein
MPRRTDLLVDQIRRAADNEDVSTTTGISNEEIVQYLNDAQDKLQAIISQQHPSVFEVQSTINITASTESYALPTDIYLDNRISFIEFKYGGGSGDYIPLRQRTIDYRYTVSEGDPAYYIRRSGNILLNPIPNKTTTDGIRITYQKRLKDLDIRRGKITSASLTGTTLNSFTLNLTSSLSKDANLQANGEAVFNDVDYICVVDKDGAVVLEKIPIDSYDADTGVLTVVSGFTTSVVAATFVSEYIVAGYEATSHTELPDMCERFLIAYCVWKLLKRDASVESDEQERELISIGSDIVAAFANIDTDIDEIPITNPEWLI